MNLPENFEWMNKLGPLPAMIIEASKLLGIQEIPGPKSNPIILGLAEEIGASKIYTNDDQSWCAVSHNAIAKRAGLKIAGYDDPYDMLRALKFQKQGTELNTDDWEVVPKNKSLFGDTMIFKRPGGGHIGIKIGESKTHFYIMGGNQKNMYGFTRVAKDRLVAVRRPKYKNGLPNSVKKYLLNDIGTPVTSNES